MRERVFVVRMNLYGQILARVYKFYQNGETLVILRLPAEILSARFFYIIAEIITLIRAGGDLGLPRGVSGQLPTLGAL